MNLQQIMSGVAVVMLAGCSSTLEPVPLGPYSRAVKTTEREVAVDLGDGRSGVIKRSEVDLSDYTALINSVPFKGLDRPPHPIEITMPIYPALLEKRGVEGVAEVYLIVNEHGMVERAAVKSASREEFGLAAVSAVLSWRFDPITRQGKPVKVAFLQVLPFRLK